MAKKPGSNPSAMRHRAAKTAAVMAAPAAVAQAQPKKRTNPAQFAKEVRAEARKITWPSRKETWITSVMVGIMVLLAAVFFATVDWGLGSGVRLVLKLASGG